MSDIFTILGIAGFCGFVLGFLNENTGFFIGRVIKALTKLFLKLIIKTVTSVYVFLFDSQKKAVFDNAESKASDNVIHATYAGKCGRELSVPGQQSTHRAPGLVYDEQRKMFIKKTAISKR